jgi:hypothetical protein
MITFTVPVKTKRSQEAGKHFRFSVPKRGVVLAGSRNLNLPQDHCSSMVDAFGNLGFSFFVGCAAGVDRSFRKALAASTWNDKTLVACAFKSRTTEKYSFGLYASKVVPDNLTPRAALHRRTVWMVKRCCMVLLFPEDPQNNSWGKGSSLAFRTAMYHLKPVFVVTLKPPKESIHYRVISADLFGLVSGYWVVPHPYEEGGTCDEEW